MKKLLFVFWFLIILIPNSYAGLIPEHEMPFGVYSSTHANTAYFSEAFLDSLHDILGINQILTTGFTLDTCRIFRDHGVYPFPQANWGQGLAYSHYVVLHPEPDSSQYYKTSFKINNGCSTTIMEDSFGDTCEYLYYSGADTMLSDLELLLQNKISWPNQWPNQYQFTPVLKIGVNPGADTNDIVGVFTAINKYYAEDSIRFIDTISVSDLPTGTVFRDTILALTNHLDTLETIHYFNTRNSLNSENIDLIKFYFTTSGECTVYIDYFKISDQYAETLLVDHEFDDELASQLGNNSYDSLILGWMLKDTEFSSNFIANGYINHFIDSVESQWNCPAYGTAWTNYFYYGYYKELLRLAQPKEIWAYLYPISDTTNYTGNSANGFQKHLNLWLITQCNTIREYLADPIYNIKTEGWVFTPQYWFCDSQAGCGHEGGREPTRSETRCMTYLGLCYKPKGIMAWKLDTSNDDEGNQGILREDKTVREGMGYAIRDDIVPFIKAVDSTYLSLSWIRAYPLYWNTISPPNGAWLEQVYGFSTGSANPDDGWFHVGEYANPYINHTSFIMLVNRSCSKNEDGDEADPVEVWAYLIEQLTGPHGTAVTDIGGDVDSLWGPHPVPKQTWEDEYGRTVFYDTLNAGQGKLYRIDLLSRVYGNVIDADSSYGISNVIVTLVDTSNALAFYVDTTNGSGYYDFPAIYPGSYILSFDKDGYCTNDADTAFSVDGYYSYEMLDIELQKGYVFLPGDANHDGQVIGSDITFIINYLRGIVTPPFSVPYQGGVLYVEADANGDCQVIGSDVMKLVSYFGGGAPPTYCQDIPKCATPPMLFNDNNNGTIQTDNGVQEILPEEKAIIGK